MEETPKKSKVSPAKKAANARWNNGHLDTLGISLRKGVKDKVKAVVERSDSNMVTFISDAIIEKALRENLITEEQAKTILEEDLEGEWIKAYNEK